MSAVLAFVLASVLVQKSALPELPTRIEFESSDGVLEQLFVLHLPVDGRLHLSASCADADPRLMAVLVSDAAEPETFTDEDSGGGTSAYLELDCARGDTIELLVGLAAPPGPDGSVQGGARAQPTVELASSLACETDASLRLADELLAELSAIDLRAEAAPRLVAQLAARLEAVAGEASPGLCRVAERLAALPRQVRTVEVEAAARSTLHAYASRHLPPWHGARLDAAAWLAAAWKNCGRPEDALELELGILDARCALAPEGGRAVQIARLNLAGTYYLLGDLDQAAVEFRALADSAEDTLAEGDALLSAARQNLAAVELERGYADEAAWRYEAVIDALARRVPEDDLGLAAARANHARALLALGRPEDAEPLLAGVVAVLRDGLPPNDPQVVACALDHGLALQQLGDLQGTRVIYERVLEGQLAQYPADHPDVLRTLQNLAAVRFELGEPHAALALYDRVIAERERRGPAADPELLFARLFRAATLRELGQLDGALAGLEAVVLDLPAGLGRAHPLVSAAHTNLSAALSERGALERARPLQEAVLADQLALLPETHPDVQRARNNLAWTLVREGRMQETATLLLASTRALEARLARFGPGLGAREIEGIASRSRGDVDEALSIVGAMPAGELRQELEARLFHLVESVRAVGLARRRVQRRVDEAAGDPDVQAAGAEVRAAQAEVVRRSREGDEGIFDAVRRRDAAQRGLLEALARAAAGSGPGASAHRRQSIDRREIAGTGPDEAAIGYWRYLKKTWDPDSLHLSAPEEHYLAHVVRASGVVRVELGPARTIDEQIERWRALVGPSEALPRGVILSFEGGAPETELTRAGRALRALVLDPLRPALGEARTVYCAPDDALSMVPFDALPARDAAGGADVVVGDALAFVYRTDLVCSAPRGADPGPGRTTTPALLAMGGIEYGGPTRSAADRLRSAWQPTFAYLPGSEAEVHTLERTFHAAFPDGTALVLTGARASRATFEGATAGATFLHLATHAYFAPDSIPSMRDDAALGRETLSALDPREQVRGFAPMLLCGLAFAGAGSVQAAAGEFPSLLTAEELATLDLSACELAVLSACDTSVGVRRAGQGVASLQSALHAAGAHTSITALWAVPDAATKELMEHFYRALWIENLGAAEALWEAKLVLRRRRDAHGRPVHALRDWAAWVLADG